MVWFIDILIIKHDNFKAFIIYLFEMIEIHQFESNSYLSSLVCKNKYLKPFSIIIVRKGDFQRFSKG